MGETSTRLIIDPDFRIGAIDRRLFGSFVEHVGRTCLDVVGKPFEVPLGQLPQA